MNNATTSNLNNSKTKKYKQIWQLGNKYVVLIDDSIIEKLNIKDNPTTFVEQEITQDNTTILMRIREIKDLWKNEK